MSPLRAAHHAARCAIVGCCLALAYPGHAQTLAITLEPPTGSVVADTVTVTAHVTTPANTDIVRVVFTVDGAVRLTDTSTPYAYEWDTLRDTEGSHAIVVTATDSRGGTAEARMSLTVDNELAKGAQVHADAALAALRRGDLSTARARMRRALRIDPRSVGAARVKAALLQRDASIDAAIAALAAADIPDTDYEARTELAALHMAATSPDIDMAAYLEHAAAAADLTHRAAIARANATKADDPASLVRRGDIRLADRQWEAAIRDYTQASDVDHATGSVGNRIVLAYIGARRLRDAETLVREMVAEKRDDAVTPALTGLRLLHLFRFAEARKAVTAIADGGSLPGLIVAGYAAIGLRDVTAARDAVRRALEIAPDNPDVLVLKARAIPDAQDPRDALVRAAAARPGAPEPLAAFALLELLRSDEKRFERAEPIARLAAKIAPESRLAALTLALCRIGLKDADGAVAILRKLRETTHAADIETVLALAYKRQDNEQATRDALDAAARLDPDVWGGLTLDRFPEIIARVFRYRLAPPMSPTTLYTARTAR